MKTSSLRAIVCIIGVLLCLRCAPSAEEQERRNRLARVKRIAVVTLIGKSSVSPTSDLKKRFMDELLAGFQKAAAKAPPVVEFLAVQNVVRDDVYQRVAKIKMPVHAYSPVPGLTYIHQGTAQGFDCGPLLLSLNADAVLFVVVDYGIAVQNSGSSFHLTAAVESQLIAPPEVSIWKGPQTFDAMLPVSIVTHPKLAASIGGKWVVMQRPSAEEYGELLKIAGESKTGMPARIGTSIVEAIVRDVKRAREKP